MTQPKRIYLTGPEVFFPAQDHRTIVSEEKRILSEYGFGLEPLDTNLAFAENELKPDRGFRDYRANRDLMDSCNAAIANLTPFRGISADPGSVFRS